MKKIVDFDQDGLRLDVCLGQWLDESRTTLAKMIKEGVVLVNGSKAKPSYKVMVDDVVDIGDYELPSIDLTPIPMDLDIVYEDKDLLVVNKPSGLVVHPGAGNFENTLVHGLLAHCDLSQMEDPIRPGLVHRIDKMTSGLLVVAKNNKVHRLLSEALKRREIHRHYWALVDGVFPHPLAKVDAPIGRDPSNRIAMTVTSTNSKPAVTHLKRLATYSNYSLLECSLETGRTHQIRVHLNYIGYPVTNDPVYGKRLAGDDFGQYLHAKTLEFTHPITGQALSLEADLPEPFQAMLYRLEKEKQ